MRHLDLTGSWRFRRDPKLLGELFPEQLHYSHAGDARWMRPRLDDSSWDVVEVPHTWAPDPEQTWRVAWYRRTFDAASLDHHQRAFLVFDGVDYLAEVWLNGRCLGSHEGYFGRFSFEVTGMLRERNVVAVRVESPVDAPGERSEIGQLKTVFKGALNRWDMNDPEYAPGGLWRGVRLEFSGATRIASVRAHGAPERDIEPEAVGEPAPAAVSVVVDLDVGGRDLRARAVAVDLELIDDRQRVVEAQRQELELVPGEHRVTFTARLAAAMPWWPWDIGRPALHRCSVRIDDGGSSETAAVRFGIRRVERREGSSLYVNGLPVFQRGANYLSDVQLGAMNRQRYEEDVRLLREANLNVVHPFCVVEAIEFYEVCDEQGMLVYQDFPVWLQMDPSGDTLRRAQVQVAEMVAHLFNHPSVCIWNLGSQPSRAQLEKDCSALELVVRRLDRTRVASQANATFAYEEGYDTDPERSFFWPLGYGDEAVERQDWRWDCHIYAGWYFGSLETLDEVPHDHLRLVTEFGAQGLPRAQALREMLPDGAAWPPRWDRYARRCAQPELLQKHVGPASDLDALVRASQRYQAELVRGHVEYYRRHKFRPCHGAHLFCFNDPWPAITWSVVEHDRTVKPAYHALARAMQPLQVFLGENAKPARAGGTLALALCVVNDTAVRHESLTVRCLLECGGRAVERAEMQVAVPPLGLTDVDGPRWKLPQPARYLLTLELAEGEHRLALNSYQLEVAGDGEE